MENIDLDNAEFRDALKVINYTNNSIFLTGKAGSGKSTFLKYITEHTKKKYVVLAPTGIAAINAGGVTLHSFFRIPHIPVLPDDVDFSYSRLRERMKYPKSHIKLIRELELVIIDEISMVRADVMDFVDRLLRYYSGKRFQPFGGKQLLLVGDVYQLEPVAKSDEREILNRYYKSVHFFSARVFQDFPLVAVELKKVYRQSDVRFISILDRIRSGKPTSGDISELNRHMCADKIADPGEFTITLTALRRTADHINDIQLGRISFPEVCYTGRVENDYPMESLPTDLELKLKVGAQVVFIKNDRDGRWVNGTIGKVYSAMSDLLEIELEDGSRHIVDQERWRHIKYVYDEENNHIEEVELGAFVQYPLRLAWAITIHKSQGLTFKKVIIDMGNGAFSGGQTYVALSRCVSIDGITLRTPVSMRDVFVNPDVVEFAKSFNDRLLLEKALDNSRADVLYAGAAGEWKDGDVCGAMRHFAEAVCLRNELGSERVVRLLCSKVSVVSELRKEVVRLGDVLSGYEQRLRSLADEYVCLGDMVTDVSDKTGVKSAFANYDKALSIVPGYVNALLGKARLCRSVHDYEGAAGLLLPLLSGDERVYDVCMLLGNIYSDTGEIADAYDCYMRASQIDGDSAEALEGMAGVLVIAGESDEANVLLRRARAIRRKGKK